MRIVMAAHSFPRSDGDIAGAFIWRLAEALDATVRQHMTSSDADIEETVA